jgi:hypothetical protein
MDGHPKTISTKLKPRLKWPTGFNEDDFQTIIGIR